MALPITELDIAGYYRDGFIVFRQILPASLVGELRVECDKAFTIAQKVRGASAQRLQPVLSYKDPLSMKPFQDYAELPAIREAITTVLSPRHYYGKPEVLGVLLNPSDQPWCTAWHRDMTLESSRMDAQSFQDMLLDWNSGNQINCPLYDDDCTWFVPGSHLRARNLPGEQAASTRPGSTFQPKLAPEDNNATTLMERERTCRDYTTAMPGAVQLRLNPGDFAMYRPLGWHIGNYVPYKKRATLHDLVFTPELETWWKAWSAGGSPKWERSVQG